MTTNILDFTIPGVAGGLRIEHTLFSHRLFQNGRQIARRGRKYEVMNDHGAPETIKITRNFPDFGYMVIARRQKTVLEPALAVWQYALGVVPLILVFVGGAIGAVVGALGSMVIFRYIRTDSSVAGQIILSLFVWVACTALFYLLALLVAGFIPQ